MIWTAQGFEEHIGRGQIIRGKTAGRGSMPPLFRSRDCRKQRKDPIVMKIRQEHKEIAQETARRITAGEDPAAAIRAAAKKVDLDIIKTGMLFRKLYGCSPYDYKSNS